MEEGQLGDKEGTRHHIVIWILLPVFGVILVCLIMCIFKKKPRAAGAVDSTQACDVPDNEKSKAKRHTEKSALIHHEKSQATRGDSLRKPQEVTSRCQNVPNPSRERGKSPNTSADYCKEIDQASASKRKRKEKHQEDCAEKKTSEEKKQGLQTSYNSPQVSEEPDGTQSSQQKSKPGSRDRRPIILSSEIHDNFLTAQSTPHAQPKQDGFPNIQEFSWKAEPDPGTGLIKSELLNFNPDDSQAEGEDLQMAQSTQHAEPKQDGLSSIQERCSWKAQPDPGTGFNKSDSELPSFHPESQAEDLLSSVTSIGKESCININLDVGTDAKLYFLRKLMALDIRARINRHHQVDCQLAKVIDNDTNNNSKSDNESFNDDLCAILNDPSLKLLSSQEIVRKMALCQFAVPLLLPAIDRSRYTFMLWAMRNIFKQWRPQSLINAKGYMEDNLVNITMPFCSFVRLGECSLSKSKILNHIISPALQMNNFFIHRDMYGGEGRRKGSEGLVEISWYFPSGLEGIDTFSEPIAVTNLRGDLKSHSQQLEILLSISAAMFIFVESINAEQFNLLCSLPKNCIEYFFIVIAKNWKPEEDTPKYFSKLAESLTLKKMNVIIKNKNVNDSQVVLKLQSAIKNVVSKGTKAFSLKQIADMVIGGNTELDEKSTKHVKKMATDITNSIADVGQFKKETMKLQGDLWRQLTALEKELCRMRKAGDLDPEEYKSQLQKEILNIRGKQSQHPLPESLKVFIKAMEGLSSLEKPIFIEWLKMCLNKIGRNNLSKLQAVYREKCKNPATDADELKIIDQRIVDNSLGIEHFIREMGQIYEAEFFVKNIKHSTGDFSKLPKIAACLLLEGLPVELIDGDASNIPMQWITSVLKQLNDMVGELCRIRVITVLGVQSTGKSTLLNTMFGTEFPVASGRCTRGAFMTLLKVKKDFQEDLGCTFIMVIDTEGLKSLELASLDGSYEHDNELATVAVGLSDVTIINMAMENTEEMKDVLQIVVHAFLRMKEVGKKPSCHFVHQNVSDVSAHVKNQKARQKFVEQLNELTRIAAKMEKSDRSNFSDIIYCDIEKHSWYIPGLWYGIPPMASINVGYSQGVQQLKQSIIRSLKDMPGKAQNISEFTDWLQSLWNAVKHEKFIFSFRNQLVTVAYNQLCIYFSDWEWRFRKNVYHWMIEMESFIFNLSHDKLQEDTWTKLLKEMHHLLDQEQRTMSKSLKTYFEDDFNNAHLLNMFQADFFKSINYLRKELENILIAKCEKTLQIQKEKCAIQALQEKYIDVIEAKVEEILKAQQRSRNSLSPEQLKTEFEKMWETTLTTLQLSKLERQNVGQVILLQLKQDLNLTEQSTMKVPQHHPNQDRENFEVNKTHFRGNPPQDIKRLRDAIISLTCKSNTHISKCVSSSKDFNQIMSLELLKFINMTLNSQDVRHFKTTDHLERDLKFYIMRKAVPEFQKMHNDFIQKNDPSSCLATLKPEYYSIFQNVFEKRNECQQRVKLFCGLCLKPAIADHLNRHLGKDILEEILQEDGNNEFKSQTYFQRSVLEDLLQRKSCEQYDHYINSYRSFVEDRISQYVYERYNDKHKLIRLKYNILKALFEKIRKVLNHLSNPTVNSVPQFLSQFCNYLKKELVISPNNLKVVIFQCNVEVKTFINDIKVYMPSFEKRIQTEIKQLNASSVLPHLTLKPEEELANKVMGCGEKCPFCKAPCEAGGTDHKEHFASIHRPRGLTQYRHEQTGALDHSICSTNIISNKSFRINDPNSQPCLYKDYRKLYPNWVIYPEASSDASDYWKFVFKELGDLFAELYKANPPNLPKDWYKITEDQALKSLKKALHTQ